MKQIILLILLTILPVASYAGDHMDVFLDQEHRRSEEIRLLNLDLEKSNLELKMKENAKKMNEIDVSSGRANQVVPSDMAMNGNARYRLRGIFISPKHREALIDVNGHSHTVVIAQLLEEGVEVAAIEDKKVTLKHKDGTSEDLVLEIS